MTDEQLRAERDKFTQKVKFNTSTKEYDGGKLKGLNTADQGVALQGNLAQRLVNQRTTEGVSK